MHFEIPFSGHENIRSLHQKTIEITTESNLTIKVKDFSFKVKGKGRDELILTHPHDIVIRKSSFVCPRTLATNCNKASNAIPRKMIKVLQNPDTKGIFTIDVI